MFRIQASHRSVFMAVNIYIYFYPQGTIYTGIGCVHTPNAITTEMDLIKPIDRVANS